MLSACSIIDNIRIQKRYREKLFFQRNQSIRFRLMSYFFIVWNYNFPQGCTSFDKFTCYTHEICPKRYAFHSSFAIWPYFCTRHPFIYCCIPEAVLLPSGKFSHDAESRGIFISIFLKAFLWSEEGNSDGFSLVRLRKTHFPWLRRAQSNLLTGGLFIQSV